MSTDPESDYHEAWLRQRNRRAERLAMDHTTQLMGKHSVLRGRVGGVIDMIAKGAHDGPQDIAQLLQTILDKDKRGE